MVQPIKTRALGQAAALTVTVCVSAFSSSAAEPPKKGWETVGSLGATLTRGNSETFLGTVGINSQRKWSRDEILLGASAGYGENTVEEDDGTVEHNTTDKYIKAFGQWNHLFTERFYAGLRVDAAHDAVAAVEYRVTISPLAGYYLIKNATTFLAVEAGPSLVLEKLEGAESDQYITLRFAERFEHKFSAKAKVWQSAEYLPRVDDFSNYVLNAEVGASAAITESVDLRIVVQDTYRSEPAEGRKSNDLKIIAGVGYRF